MGNADLDQTVPKTMAGSLGYAERLTWRDDVGGTLGTPEFDESNDDATLQKKIDKLTALIVASKEHGGMVVHTGAGISTSVGIPDFRGPNGVWTAQQKKIPPPKASCAFDTAKPSLTHMALVALQKNGFVKYVVSCNVDCLHLRSGLPRDKLAELHGNCFAERCKQCGTEYIRDFEMQTAGIKLTGRRCIKEGCVEKGTKRKRGDPAGSALNSTPPPLGSKLRDQVLDWDDALPETELNLAEKHSGETSLALVLGSSLQITPSCDVPLKTISKANRKKRGGKLVIVNLQETNKDKYAHVLIHAKTDLVMAGVMQRLGLQVPDYERIDSVTVAHTVRKSKEGNDSARFDYTLRIGSSHGFGHPTPWLAKIDVDFLTPLSRLGQRTSYDPSSHTNLFEAFDFGYEREPDDGFCVVELTFTFVDGCTERAYQIPSHELRHEFHDDHTKTYHSETIKYGFTTSRIVYAQAVKTENDGLGSETESL